MSMLTHGGLVEREELFRFHTQRQQHIDPDLPLVVVCNYLELFAGFLDHLGNPCLRHSRKFADRDLYWLGDPKLVVTSTPVDEAAALCHRWGCPGTETLSPEFVSDQLCLDVLRDEQVLRRVVEYAGSRRTLQIVPYVSTPEVYQLAEALRRDHGLSVSLPESPAPQDLWVRDYVDTKIGFRLLASEWLNDRSMLPMGFISHGIDEIVRIILSFLARGQSCVAKYDRGGGGVGNCFFYAQEGLSETAIRDRLAEQDHLFTQPAVVEEFIQPHQQLSPSLELFVPPPGKGAPFITYVCNQLFEQAGVFVGILIDRAFTETNWYAPLAEAGLTMARNLQAMGYVGYFDLDAVLDENERLYLLEINSRRTGGTYVDDFARRMIGPNYQERMTLFSTSSVNSGEIRTTAELLKALDGLLYPVHNHSGIVITSVSTLPEGKFGALLIAPNHEEILELWRMLQHRLRLLEPQEAPSGAHS